MDGDAIRDLFAGLGAVQVRRMFGGQGIYLGEAMFALEIGGELYLKADSESAGAFETAGSARFVYMRAGRPRPMGYWRLPDAALDDPEEAAGWGRLALAAARRAAGVRKGKGAKGAKAKGARKRPA